MVNLINRLPADAWHHAVVALTEIDRNFCRRVKRSDVAYVALHKRPGHAIPLYPRLFRLFRKLDPAIVHTRNLAALEACVPAWAAGVPARVHGEHGRDVDDLDGSNTRQQWVRRVFRPFVTHYVALSPDLEHYLGERVGVSATESSRSTTASIRRGFVRCLQGGRRSRAAHSRIRTCGWSVPSAAWNRSRIRPIWRGLRPCLAIASRSKATDAARSRRRRAAEAAGRCHSAGCGRARPRVAAGRARRRPGLLRGLDCFVLPSLAEGVSNTILEAMATGLPVVATRVGGNAELIEAGVTGRLVPAGDSEALARDDPRLLRRSRDGAAPRTRGAPSGRAAFQSRRMVERYHGLYSELARSRRRTATKRRAAAPGPRANG